MEKRTNEDSNNTVGEIALLSKLEAHLARKYGVRNTKGAEILSKRCHVDTILVSENPHSDVWKSVSIEPIYGKFAQAKLFRIVCEIEEELRLGITKKDRTEEVVVSASIPSGSFGGMTVLY